MHESTAQRIVTRTEQRLLAADALDRVRLAATESLAADAVVVVDASESPIERPQKNKATFTVGKHTHTQKFQLVIGQASGHILHVAQAVSNEHDVTLARQHRRHFRRVVYASGIWATKGWRSKVAES
ncbi:MAG: hypothetical protein HZT40_03210 [Candidatus Thiothrix singaporensis]|uniref:Transposase IS4-like domain-containing protein n=1 Tax=Candidatus Thiothrix singaporensis TaxID=2799669 RepID=A0A7L6ANZ7_9GAMM|nr:MAG: hypothetical protein HZT40_03210 [Candidatus Thiothrix singaporensis]